MRTAVGRDFQSEVMGNGPGTGAGTGTMRPADYIGLTENNTAPADTDTALTGELATAGLTRAQATFAHTTGASTYTLTKAFTSGDATTRTINKIGVFNAAAAGRMPFTTAVPSPPVLATGDQVTITETVTI